MSSDLSGENVIAPITLPKTINAIPIRFHNIKTHRRKIEIKLLISNLKNM